MLCLHTALVYCGWICGLLAVVVVNSVGHALRACCLLVWLRTDLWLLLVFILFVFACYFCFCCFGCV